MKGQKKNKDPCAGCVWRIWTGDENGLCFFPDCRRKEYDRLWGTSGTTVKPGPAKVTVVATAGKHPYHLVHTDGTSTVYGWVDAAAITGKASATPAVKTYTVKAGDSLWRIAAQQLGNGARYKEIKTLNGLKNNTIHAGQVLKLPN